MTGDRTDLSPTLKDAVSQSRREFAAIVRDIRPRLHRFASRMCGSVLDGEDVVQEALADAFYNLASLNDPARLEPWLFRITYFKSVDFLRREAGRRADASIDEEHDRAAEPDVSDEWPLEEALLTLVAALPPKERAAVLLKEVLGYSLEDIAGIADTTLAGAKAALHRARAKLRTTVTPIPIRTLGAERRELFDAYAECFNRRDWDALRKLVRADARLEIVGAKSGVMAGLGSTYQSNYLALPWDWRLDTADVGGETVVVHSRRVDGQWQPHTAIRLWWQDGYVTRIRDYVHVDYLLTG